MTDRKVFGVAARVMGLIVGIYGILESIMGIVQWINPETPHSYPVSTRFVFGLVGILFGFLLIGWTEWLVRFSYRHDPHSN